MSKNTVNRKKQTRKHKQAQKSMETIVVAMSGTKKVKLQKPDGLKLTNATQTTNP